MNEIFTEAERLADLSDHFAFADVLWVMLLSFALSMIVAFVYRYTHQGVAYSQTYAQTLVVLGMIVALIMLIVGSNLARAFSLVGALSIIRFRNAVKETRDVGFVFLVMALGMACGTRFYALAAVATVFLCASILFMHHFDLFRRNSIDRILCVRFSLGETPEQNLSAIFARYTDDARLLAVQTLAGGSQQELIYSIALKREADAHALLDALRAINQNLKISLVLGQQELDL